MSGLERFKWYRLPRPLLDGLDFGMVKEIDIYDGEAVEIQIPPVVTSDTMCNFKFACSVLG